MASSYPGMGCRAVSAATFVLWGALFAGCAGKDPAETVGETSAPTVPTLVLTLTPAEPTTGDDLVATANLDGASYAWTVDGAAWGSGDTVPAAETTKGQEWTVTATAEGVTAEASVVVVNSPPDPAAVVVAPTAPQEATDDLTCAVTLGADADGDALSVAVHWVDGDGVERIGPVTRVLPGDTLPAGSLVAGASWRCVATVTDGDDEVVSESAAAVVVPFDLASVDPWIEPEVLVDPIHPAPGAPLTLTYAGPIAASTSTLDVVLGFDGWVGITWDTPAIPRPSPEGDPRSSWRLPMAWDGAKWSVTFTPPADARAVHFLFEGTDSGGAPLVDDRDGLEHHWGLQFPYVGPWLTWSDGATAPTGLVVSFETDVPSFGVVLVAEADGDGLVAFVGAERDTLHHIPVTGLQPDTEYQYTVLDSTGGSATHTFRTPPEGAEQASLLVMADMQDGGTSEDQWPRVAELAHEIAPEAVAIIAPGDLAANDHPGFWWRYFNGGGALFASVPQVPMLGNHDTPGKDSNADTTSYVRWFTLPTGSGAEEYYQVDIGPARVFALSSEVPEEMLPGGVQYTWLAEALDETASDPAAPTWVFVGFHHPPYDVGNRFWGEVGLYRPVTDLFDGVVDWALTGHEHLYQRTHPVQFDGVLAASGAYGPGPEDGTGYLVTPSAGDLLFNQVAVPALAADAWALTAHPAPPEGSPFYPEEHGFVHFELDGRTLTLSSWAVGVAEQPEDPWVRDSISYTKP